MITGDDKSCISNYMHGAEFYPAKVKGNKCHFGQNELVVVWLSAVCVLFPGLLV